MKTRKMKKWAALSMTSLMAVSVLAGCGGDSDPGEKKGGEAASGKTEIVVWTRDSTVAAVKSAAKKYNEQNENVEVKVVEQPASQMADQLSLALSSGEAPRSEERRVGKECSEPCRSRWSPYH